MIDLPLEVKKMRQRKYTGTPASTMSSPGQVFPRVFSEINKSTAIPEAATMYRDGTTGYPTARYGRSASGRDRRNTNTPAIVSA